MRKNKQKSPLSPQEMPLKNCEVEMIYDVSEFVSSGHPDKVADQIADAFLDYFLSFDPYSRVAIEVLLSHTQIVVAGEVSSHAPPPDFSNIVRKVLTTIGYSKPEWGNLADSHRLLVEIAPQSPDISLCLSKKELSAGDQGIVIGYATNETASYMPLAYELSREMVQQIELLRNIHKKTCLGPDGKLELLLKDKHHGEVIVSWQHLPHAEYDEIASTIQTALFQASKLFGITLDALSINKAGPFTLGGPYADTGLSGRKQLIDTYGSRSRHGGGSFSGKDGTKVDRSGAYMARCMAKTVVAADLAEQCEVGLLWAIGAPKPIGITLDCRSTERVPLESIKKALLKTFDLRLEAIISLFSLSSPIFFPTASLGHFGRAEFPWETLSFTHTLKKNIS